MVDCQYWHKDLQDIWLDGLESDYSWGHHAPKMEKFDPKKSTNGLYFSTLYGIAVS